MTTDTDYNIRHMVDSAFPLPTDPLKTPDGQAISVLLVYAGGDTPHPWTKEQIVNNPYQYVWPTWVRSDPSSVNADADAALFVAWLKAMGVPVGCYVILDLEVAVDSGFVAAFNLALRAAGYRVTKYGSQNFIWDNPATDGGTYVAFPGGDALSTEGDTVARQYDFLGGDDLSILYGQERVMLWEPKAKPKPPKVNDQPGDIRGVARFTNATISWKPSTKQPEIGYMVYLADENGKTIRKVPLGPTATHFEFRHIETNTSYKLGVLAKPEGGGTTQYVTVKTL